MSHIIFLADGRDFHAIDWYRTIVKICPNKIVCLATDVIHAEGREVLLKKEDIIIDLFNIDGCLFKKQSELGNYWRNFVKMLFIPIQVYKLKKIANKHLGAIFHAHTMYYLFIAWLSGIEYIGSPQGDEILIRPYSSKLYHFFAKRALVNAKFLIVDSENLKKGINKIANKDADVIQYGIDVKSINREVELSTSREGIVSIRAWYPLYRISHIIDERNKFLSTSKLTFFFPFFEDGYVNYLNTLVKPFDLVLGRLANKNDVYKVLSRSELIISIPESDSSPRSVYESIFCGCVVAVTYNPWIESLPACMKERIIVVDLDRQGWMEDALNSAKVILKKAYKPSLAAVEMFDQDSSMMKVAKKYYL